MDDLDDLFARAKAAPVQPSDALMARVLADALREQPKAVVVRPVRGGLWAGLADVFGGGGVLAGMGSVAALGMLVGFVQPATLTSVSDLWAGDTLASVDMMPGIDALLAEE